MIIEVCDLNKSFGSQQVIKNVSFGVNRGQMVGLVGPNGAGKTTIVHTMLGLIAPDSGRIHLFGQLLEEHRSEILSRLNFTSPYSSFPGRLTVMENLVISARLYGVSQPRRIISALLDQFRIASLANRPVSHLSSGEVTRMALCKAFINDPELLLLDEPTAYMDPYSALQTRMTLLELQRRRGTTIMFTSHNTTEVQQICDHIILLSRGRILTTGSPIEVTRHILEEEREMPALEEVFIRIATSA